MPEQVRQDDSVSVSIASKLDDKQIDKIFDQDNNPIEEIKARIAKQSKSQSGIGIGRIPIETKDEFMDLAESKFADDYGMTLGFLVDYFKTVEGRRAEDRRVEEKLDEILDEVRN